MRTAADIKTEMDQVANDILQTRESINRIRREGAYSYELKEGEKALKKLNAQFSFLKDAYQVAICYNNEKALADQLAKVWDRQKKYNKRLFERLREAGGDTVRQKVAEKEVKNIFNPSQLDKQEKFLKYILVK